jgi:hypothetical protein
MIVKKIEVKYIDTDRVLITDFRQCYCRTVGKDDGDMTCFKHHNCMWGECTHIDDLGDY